MPPDPRPLLLALDTSTARAGVALYDGDVIAEATWPAQRQAGQSLLVEVRRLLDAAGRAPAHIAAVAVAVGPGSFSALRVGLSTAKGLALALGCPLLGISTLEATAAPHRGRGGTVWALVDAGRARVVAAPFAGDEGGWGRRGEPWHGPAADLAGVVAGPALVCGEVSPAVAPPWPSGRASSSCRRPCGSGGPGRWRSWPGRAFRPERPMIR
jgi:tRNA threonylcarbamoyladenosine biosynthesis protein TsaB